MIRVIMHGCNGKMGQVITGLCKEDPDVEKTDIRYLQISTHVMSRQM